MTSLSILGALAFVAVIASFCLCYLRRPEKTPAVLVSIQLQDIERNYSYVIMYNKLYGKQNKKFSRGQKWIMKFVEKLHLDFNVTGDLIRRSEITFFY